MSPFDAATIGAREFRQTIGQFATGVTVVSAETDGVVHAMTVSSFTSVSLDPLLVLVCIGKHGRLADVMRRAGGFTASILHEDQQALSTFFAGAWTAPEPPAHRFVQWAAPPRLDGCIAAIGCARHDVLEGGDHWILLGRVVALHLGDEPRRPLIYCASRYNRIASASSGTIAPNSDPGVPGSTL